MKTLLLLLDLQEDFLSQGGLVPLRSRLVANLSTLLKRCRADGIPLAHVRMEVGSDPDERMPHWKAAGRWMCRSGTAGAESPPELEVVPGEACFTKTRFSAFQGTKLEDWLRENDFERIVIAGVHTHTCIRETALDAYQLGFEVGIASDAVGSYSPFEASSTLLYLQRRGIPHGLSEVLLWGQLPDSNVSEFEGLERAILRSSSSEIGDRALVTECLSRFSTEVREHSEEYALAIVKEVGKPVAMARGEVARAVDLVEANIRQFLAEEATLLTDEGRIYLRPRGTIAIITPWNNPLAIAIGQIVPALLYGNRVLWKPSPRAQAISARLLEGLRKCDLSEESLQIIEGGAEVACRLAAEPNVDAVTFTGSCDAAWMIAAACRPNGTELQAEMGGNNAVILWEGIQDEGEIARQVAEAAFGFAGQRCTAIRRVIVHEDDLENWWSRLCEATATLKWGSPVDETTQIGPVASEAKADELNQVLQRAISKSLRVEQPHISQGRAPNEFREGSAYFPPTLVLAKDPGLEIVQEESFGPILVLQPATNFTDALDLLNGVRHGLTATLVGGDGACRDQFKQSAAAGILRLDEVHAGAGVEMPFGGWKASGWGPPQHGKSNRTFYSKLQAIYEQEETP